MSRAEHGAKRLVSIIRKTTKASMILLAMFPLGASLAMGCDSLLADNSASDSPAQPKPFSARKPFSIEQQNGISWLVKPNGNRFFSFGVCCVSQGASRKEFDPKNPGYAAWQHYVDSNHWA